MKNKGSNKRISAWRLIIAASVFGLMISIVLPGFNRIKGSGSSPQAVTLQGRKMQRLADNAFNRIIWNRDSTRIAFASSVNPSIWQIASHLLTRSDRRYPRELFIFKSWSASLESGGDWTLHPLPDGLMVDSYANSGSQVAGTMFRGVDLPRTPVRYLIGPDETISIRGGRDVSISGYSPDEERLLALDDDGDDSVVRIVLLQTGQRLTASLGAEYAYWRSDNTIIGLQTSGPRFEKGLKGVWLADTNGNVIRQRSFDKQLGNLVRIGLIKGDRLAVFSRPIRNNDQIVGFILNVDTLSMEPVLRMEPGIVDVRISRNEVFYAKGRARDNITSIHRIDLKTRQSSTVLNLDVPPLSAADTFSVSPDGKWLVAQASFKDSGRGLYITSIDDKRVP